MAMQDIRTAEGWLLRSSELTSNIGVPKAMHWHAEVWAGVECLASVDAPTERAARRCALKEARTKRALRLCQT